MVDDDWLISDQLQPLDECGALDNEESLPESLICDSSQKTNLMWWYFSEKCEDIYRNLLLLLIVSLKGRRKKNSPVSVSKFVVVPCRQGFGTVKFVN